ncbi:ATP-grasp domain-containing protein [Peribacillus simplex]|uniref:ATP-grasp domain-containing protein n=1 Tax=Peribacillus simplex TaxID=1478 RepID=UPI003D2CB910
MKKKLLFIESNTTGTGMLLLSKTKTWGLEPIFITHNPNIYIGLNETGCEILICNTNSITELMNFIKSSFTNEEIAGIMTTSEYYLTIVSELTKDFHLPGNPPAAVNACRNKYKTRLALAEANIKQPQFSVVHTISEIEEAVSEISLPCVVKPIDDSGSNHVRLCETLADVIEQFQKIMQIDYNPRGQDTAKAVLIEEYLDYQEYSVEMFSWQGDSICIGITEKNVKGYPYFVEYKHIFPTILSIDIKKKIIQTVSAALEAVGFVDGVTHTEIKLTKDGCAVIEINARPAGGMIPELIRYVTGIDLLELQTKAVIGEKPLIKVNYKGYAGIHFIVSNLTGTLVGINGIDEVEKLDGIKVVNVTSKLGDEITLPNNSSHRLGYIIALTKTYEETENLLDRANKMIKLKIRE